MQDLLNYLLKAVLGDEKYEILETEEEGRLIYSIKTDPKNIGMVIGILPIVGIPLPLLSYGLTNLWVTMASLGMLNNIAIRRFYY